MLVGVGGALGAVSRYIMYLLFAHWNISSYWAIALANVLGCFLIGVLASFISSGISSDISNSGGEGKGLEGGLTGELAGGLSGDINNPLWLFAAIGVLGGYTTFSTFGLHLLEMLQQDKLLSAMFYTTGSLVGGVLFCLLGFYLCRSLVLS